MRAQTCIPAYKSPAGYGGGCCNPLGFPGSYASILPKLVRPDQVGNPFPWNGVDCSSFTAFTYNFLYGACSHRWQEQCQA